MGISDYLKEMPFEVIQNDKAYKLTIIKRQRDYVVGYFDAEDYIFRTENARLWCALKSVYYRLFVAKVIEL